MNSLYQFITVFCSASLLFGGVYLLKPSGNTAKTVKYVFALIFLSITVTALFNIKTDDIFINASSSSYTVDNTSLVENAARLTFEEALRSSDINFTKITVCTNKNENGSIIINKVTVYSTDDKQKILEALGRENAEYEIEVCYE